MNEEVHITHHGKKRIKERTGIGKSEKKIQRAAEKALKNGKRYEDLKGTLRRYIDRMIEKHQDGENVRLYGGQIWVFNNNILITVKPVPARYQRKYQIYMKGGNKDEEEIQDCKNFT